MNRISELFIKRLTGPLSAAEEAELESWADECDANRELYRRLTTPSELKRAMDVWQMIDSSRPCAETQRKVSSMLLKRRLRRVLAAVAVLAIFVGCLTVLWPDREKPGRDMLAVNSGPLAVSQIKHGVVRAVLSDASGHTKELKATDTAGVAPIFAETVAEDEMQEMCLDVPRGGEFKIELEDGTEVWLNSDSKLYYPSEFSENNRSVRCEGEVYFTVATDSLRPFYVETGGQRVRVYGTRFNVRNYPEEDEVYTTLEEGLVSLSRAGSSDSELYLSPGHQAVFNTADSCAHVRTVNTDVVTSWRKGRFVFENQSLLRIMQDLSRWYDFDYEFADRTLEKEEFMGSIPRYSDFNTAISVLEKCGGIRFAVSDGKVIISRLPKQK